jgi:hypothetical protein
MAARRPFRTAARMAARRHECRAQRGPGGAPGRRPSPRPVGHRGAPSDSSSSARGAPTSKRSSSAPWRASDSSTSSDPWRARPTAPARPKGAHVWTDPPRPRGARAGQLQLGPGARTSDSSSSVSARRPRVGAAMETPAEPVKHRARTPRV